MPEEEEDGERGWDYHNGEEEEEEGDGDNDFGISPSPSPPPSPPPSPSHRHDTGTAITRHRVRSRDVAVSPTHLSKAAKKRRVQNGLAITFRRNDGDDDDDVDVDDDDDDENNNDGGDDVPAPGIIEMIKLENFMCHRNLEVTFDPRVNIVHGANGAGKSAILTALMVCLGAKAIVARGASRLKDLIRHGEQQARITLRLNNRGSDAFRHDVYGDHIVIMKTITQSNTSSIRITASNGSRVASKSPSRELSAICDRFNIQIDSPSTAMTQDNAKFFLADSNPRQKYEFFHRSTQLQPIVEGFSAIRSNTESMRRVLHSKEDMLQVERRKMERAEKEYQNAKTLQEIEQQLDDVNRQLSWAIVRDKQKELEMERTTLGQVERKIEKVRNDMLAKFGDGSNSSEDDSAQVMDRLRKTMDDLNAQLKVHKDDYHNLEQSKYAVERDEKKAIRAQEEIRKQIQKMRVDIERNNRAIERLQKDSSRERGAEVEKLQGILRDLQAKFEALDQQIADKDQELRLTKERHGDLKSMEGQLHEQKKKRENSIRKYRQQIKSLEDQKKEKFTSYGRNMLALLRKIEQYRNKFERVPIGPIGSIITVKHTKWADAVEKVIGDSLRRFICNSQHDERLLRELAASVDVSNAVIVQRFASQRYPIGLIMRNKPHHDLLTVYDELMIDEQQLASHPVRYVENDGQRMEILNMIDATIMNALVDWHNIEGIILVEGRRNAIELMFPNPPANVSCCFTETGTQLFVKGHSQVEIGSQRKARFLAQIDIDAQIAEHKSKQQVERSELARLEVEITQTNRDAKTLENQALLLFNNYKALKREKLATENKIEKCETEINEIVDDSINAEKIAHEREMIEYLNGKINHENERLDGLAQQLADVEKKKQEINQDMDEEKCEIEELEKEVEHVGSQMKDRDKRQAVMNHQKRLMEEELERREKECTTQKQKIQKLQTDLQEALGAAEKFERVETEKPVLDLVDLRGLLCKRQAAVSREFGGRDFTTIENQYHQAKTHYMSKMKTILLGTDIENRLKHSLKARIRRYGLVRDAVSLRTSKEFNMYLRHCHYSGSLEFNHEDKTLDVHVQTGDARNERTTRSLSGGEKSFAMVSLLMALWDAVECPFRAMDETDVFMDDVHRKTALDLLISTSLERYSHRQLILLTPQSVTHLQERPGLMVLRLRPPDRRTMQQQSLHNIMPIATDTSSGNSNDNNRDDDTTT